MEGIELSRRAEKDLRRIGPGPDLQRIRRGLQRLSAGDQSLDVKALAGRTPWMRLRVGDWRVIFRLIDEDDTKFLVARIVSRGHLDQAIETL